MLKRLFSYSNFSKKFFIKSLILFLIFSVFLGGFPAETKAAYTQGRGEAACGYTYYRLTGGTDPNKGDLINDGSEASIFKRYAKEDNFTFGGVGEKDALETIKLFESGKRSPNVYYGLSYGSLGSKNYGSIIGKENGKIIGNKNIVLVSSYAGGESFKSTMFVKQVIFKSKKEKGNYVVLEPKSEGIKYDQFNLASKEALKNCIKKWLEDAEGVTPEEIENIATAMMGDKNAEIQKGYDDAVEKYLENTFNKFIKEGDFFSNKPNSCINNLDPNERQIVFKALANQAGFYSPTGDYTNSKKILTKGNIQKISNLPEVKEILDRKCPGEFEIDKLGYLHNKKAREETKKKFEEEAEKIQNSLISSIDPTNSNDGSCAKWVSVDLYNCIAQVLYYILSIFSFFVGIIAYFFNKVIEMSVLNMKETLDPVGVIKTGWSAIRDVTNITFIFILLFLAIKQILGVDDHGVKSTLSKLILVAVLLNFSLFFTKVMIDASNIVTIEFYNKAIPINKDGTRPTIGDAFMNQFRMQTIYKGQSSGTGNIFDQANRAASRQFAAKRNPGTIFIMGMIFMIVASVVMIASLSLFLKRFVVFIFLLILSPLAFAGSLFPKGEEIASQWWKSLFAECIFAPVYMILLWLVFKILYNEKFQNSLKDDIINNVNNGTIDSIVGTIFSFAVVIFLLVGTLIIASKVGASGGEGAAKWVGRLNEMRKNTFKNTVGWAGGQTLGRGARWWREKGWGNNIQNRAGGKGGLEIKKTDGLLKRIGKRAWNQATLTGARLLDDAAQGIRKSSFGGSHTSIDDQIHSEEERIKNTFENTHGDFRTKAQIIRDAMNPALGGASQSRIAAEHIWHEESVDNKTTIAQTLEKEAEDAWVQKQQQKIRAAGTYAGLRAGDREKAEKREAQKRWRDLSSDDKLKEYQKIKAHEILVSGHHARLTPEEKIAIERRRTQGNDFINSEFKKAIESDEADFEHILEQMNTNQLISALEGTGEELRDKLFRDSEKMRILKQAISTRLGNEQLFSSMAKNPIYREEFMNELIDSGRDAAITYDLNKILSDSAGARGNADMQKAFIDSIKKYASGNMLKAIENFELSNKSAADFKEVLDVYKKSMASVQSRMKGFFSNSSAKRSLSLSQKILENIEKMKKACIDAGFTEDQIEGYFNQ